MVVESIAYFKLTVKKPDKKQQQKEGQHSFTPQHILEIDPMVHGRLNYTAVVVSGDNGSGEKKEKQNRNHPLNSGRELKV